jgi:hypothetical protein
MNFQDILRDNEAIRQILKWIFEDEEYNGSGYKWKKDVEHDWPKFWAAIPKFFPTAKDHVKEMCKDSDVVFISRTIGQLWFKFSKLQASKSGVQIGSPGLVLMLDKDLNVKAKRG